MGREGFEPPKPSGGGFTVHSLWPLGHLPTLRCRVRAAPPTRTRHRGSLRQGVEPLPSLLKESPPPRYQYQVPGARYPGPDTPDPCPIPTSGVWTNPLASASPQDLAPGSLPSRRTAVLPHCPIAFLPNYHRAVQTPSPDDYITPPSPKDQVPSGRARTGPPDTLRRPHSDIPSPSYRPPSPPSSRAESDRLSLLG